MGRSFWVKWASVTVAIAGGAVALYLGMKYLLPLFFPFLVALGLAAMTRRTVLRISARLGGREKLAAAFVTGFCLLCIGIFAYFLTILLVSQLSRLAERLMADLAEEGGVVSAVSGLFEGLLKLPWIAELSESPLFGELLQNPEERLREALTAMLSAMASHLPTLLGGVLARLPALLLLVLVTVIACFFTAMDFPRVTGALRRLLPARVSRVMPSLRRRAAGGVKRCLRAYFLLFLMTFGELFLAFLLLRERYAFLLAFLTALLDIFPVLGVGTVLVPWGVFRLCTGNIGGGVALLLVYAAVTVVRQIAEPHLVGKSIGLHPLSMLISFYVGLRLFGISGIVIGPGAALVIKAMLDKKEEPTP